jgi:hypothetical protein
MLLLAPHKPIDPGLENSSRLCEQGVVQKRLFSGNTGVIISPPRVLGFCDKSGSLMAAWFAAAGSGPQRLRLSEAKQREPVRVRLPRHQLLGTLANSLSNSAA